MLGIATVMIINVFIKSVSKSFMNFNISQGFIIPLTLFHTFNLIQFQSPQCESCFLFFFLIILLLFCVLFLFSVLILL